ncbi:MAG: DNA primase [Planctomycetota bacterium]
MRNFHDVKERIRQSVDLVDLVSEHVSLKRAGRTLKGLCPFHKEKTPSFNVLPDRQIFKCFGCNAGGDVFKFVQLAEKVDFAEAVRILADRIGLELKPSRVEGSGAPAIGRADLGRANEWAAAWFRQQLLGDGGVQARAYLEGRRIAPDVAERFQIGLAPADGRLREAAQPAGLSTQLLLAADLLRVNEQGAPYETFRDRLIFPIRDVGQRCIGFGGRALGEARAKYLNTAANELFDKSRCLYGLPLAREEIRNRARVVVVEGYTDCIACHQHGFANTVATLGTAATEEQMRALRRYTDTAILLFDSDTAGQAAAERALAVALQYNLTVRIAQVPAGKDPAEYLQTTGPKEFSELLNSAVDALGFMWNRTLSRFRNQAGGSDRRQAVVEFVNLVRDSSRFGAVDTIQRGVVIHQIARLLALPANEVAGLLVQRSERVTRAPAKMPAPGIGTGPLSAASDAEQLALVSLLEILVCEPGLLAEVREVFGAERFKDPALRHIAEVFLQLAEQRGDFTASDLLAGLESPAEAQMVADMVFRAEKRGNLSATLAGVREQLKFLDDVRRSREAGERVKRAQPASPDGLAEAEENAFLSAVNEGTLRYHHFAAAGQAFRGEGSGDPPLAGVSG